MKSKRYTEEQIIGFLKAHESGAKVTDLVRQHGFSEQSFCRWKSKFGGAVSALRHVDATISQRASRSQVSQSYP